MEYSLVYFKCISSIFIYSDFVSTFQQYLKYMFMNNVKDCRNNYRKY